jgi:hypothetical protein
VLTHKRPFWYLSILVGLGGTVFMVLAFR